MHGSPRGTIEIKIKYVNKNIGCNTLVVEENYKLISSKIGLHIF